ncbi:porin [Vibrio intestinalis]|uniref:porin n=1 Tax=Vibrio intestinalis TaxID=2933291 RepID=UPI0021A742B9|nr:porin [Vibrio intestinalis]
MLKKSSVAIAISSLFLAANASAVTIYENDSGDFVKLYGEVGVGGHIGAEYEYGEFYKDQEFIDDSFATMGVKGKQSKMHYRLELDYERENWAYGSGDLVLAIDKMFIGYDVYQTQNMKHYLEFGLTDTAFDDYDKWGDFTFDTTVETGEAGDQDSTVKYEGLFYQVFKVGASFTYGAESSSGSALGDVSNGYIGYFGDRFSVVFGIEGRVGSDGESKYGKQELYGGGARFAITDDWHLGVNFYQEEEYLGSCTNTLTDSFSGESKCVGVYNDYQKEENSGFLTSVKYIINPQWEMTGSYNYEKFEKWELAGQERNAEPTDWDNERKWGTVGISYKPTRSSVIALEMNMGEAAQDAYAYARVYF